MIASTVAPVPTRSTGGRKRYAVVDDRGGVIAAGAGNSAVGRGFRGPCRLWPAGAALCRAARRQTQQAIPRATASSATAATTGSTVRAAPRHDDRCGQRDTYVADTSSDVIVELEGGSIDTGQIVGQLDARCERGRPQADGRYRCSGAGWRGHRQRARQRHHGNRPGRLHRRQGGDGHHGRRRRKRPLRGRRRRRRGDRARRRWHRSDRASISTTIAAQVENLVLLGSANLDSTGNALANAADGQQRRQSARRRHRGGHDVGPARRRHLRRRRHRRPDHRAGGRRFSTPVASSIDGRSPPKSSA